MNRVFIEPPKIRILGFEPKIGHSEYCLIEAKFPILDEDKNFSHYRAVVLMVCPEDLFMVPKDGAVPWLRMPSAADFDMSYGANDVLAVYPGKKNVGD